MPSQHTSATHAQNFDLHNIPGSPRYFPICTHPTRLLIATYPQPRFRDSPSCALAQLLAPALSAGISEPGLLEAPGCEKRHSNLHTLAGAEHEVPAIDSSPEDSHASNTIGRFGFDPWRSQPFLRRILSTCHAEYRYHYPGSACCFLIGGCHGQIICFCLCCGESRYCISRLLFGSKHVKWHGVEWAMPSTLSGSGWGEKRLLEPVYRHIEHHAPWACRTRSFGRNERGVEGVVGGGGISKQSECCSPPRIQCGEVTEPAAWGVQPPARQASNRHKQRKDLVPQLPWRYDPENVFGVVGGTPSEGSLGNTS